MWRIFDVERVRVLIHPYPAWMFGLKDGSMKKKRYERVRRKVKISKVSDYNRFFYYLREFCGRYRIKVTSPTTYDPLKIAQQMFAKRRANLGTSLKMLAGS